MLSLIMEQKNLGKTLKKTTRKNLVFTCGREPSYPRNDMIISTLKDHYNLQTVTSSYRYLLPRYISLALQYNFVPWKEKNLVIVGFVGHPLVLLLRLFFQKKPILFDTFISIYDTLCFDRQTVKPNTLLGKLAYWLDYESINKSNIVLFDTETHASYFRKTFNVPNEKTHVLFVGCDETIFYPRNILPDDNMVLYYGSYLPLHGTETIVKAAHLLEKKSSIQFKIIGQGLETKRIRNLAEKLGNKNIEFIPSVSLNKLPDYIQAATICLGGHFGKTEKASRVIAGKTYQCMAMGKATIVGENAANLELLTHGIDSWFCQMNNSEALADAIEYLIKNRKVRTELEVNTRKTFLDKASYSVLGEQLRSIINSMLQQ
jgi:glycosyltransferase involved in cell wall biosynthesis